MYKFANVGIAINNILKNQIPTKKQSIMFIATFNAQYLQ